MTNLSRRPWSYRNQFKSVDWFVYDHDLRRERVKRICANYLTSVPLNSSENLWYLDDFKGNGSFLILSNALNITSKIWWQTFNGISLQKISFYRTNIYLFKVNNRNTRKRCNTCSKLTTKTAERRQWPRSSAFIVNFEHISHLFLLLSIVDFQQVNVSWVREIK